MGQDKRKLNTSQLEEECSNLLKTKFSTVSLILTSTLVTVIVLSGYVFYKVINRPDPPAYVFNTVGTENSRLVRLELPDISNEAVLRWTSQAVSEIFTFNFTLQGEHFSKIAKYFTPEGYNVFLESAKGFQESASGKEKALKYDANSCDVASIINTTRIRTLNSDSTVWWIEVPLLIQVESRSSLVLKRYVVTAIVEASNKVRSDQSIGMVGLEIHEGSRQYCSLSAIMKN